MPKGYVIGQITITKPEDYPAYVAKVGPVLEKFGARFLVRGGQQQVFEADAVGERTVIVEFPSYETALEWYNSEDYAEAKSMRMAASTSVQTIVEGV